MPSRTPRRILHCVALLVCVVAGPELFAAEVDVANAPETTGSRIILDERVSAMPDLPYGPFVHLDGGRILGIDKNETIISSDGGKSWTRSPIFPADQPMEIRPERALIKTRNGVLILLFINDAVRNYAWDKESNLPKPEMHLPSYSIRSLDEGKTWTDLNLLHDGWCGCLLDVIQTTNGNIVVPGQELLYADGRHATMPYVSTDEGKTWQRTRYLDLGGQGDHAGAIEGTLEQLKDGRLWMLIRSYHGFFYETYSPDEGLSWTEIQPSAITSTGSPGKLLRLASGRLALFWNALPNEGYVRREELSVSLSDDDGVTWSPARVIARNKGGRVSYVHAFEAAPGELWITTMQGDLRARLREADFLGPWTPIVAFGDSTTATRGTLRIYADILEDELPEVGLEVKLFNAGIPGNTTEDGRARFQTDVLDKKPRIVILQFGINDAAIDLWRNPPATQPRISLARYRENLTYFIQELTSRAITPVLMTPNPMRWSVKTRDLYGKPPYRPEETNGFNVVLRDYAEAVREIAKSSDVALVDVYRIFEQYSDREGRGLDELLLDGMHPNDGGHRMIADGLKESIQGILGTDQ